MAPTLTQNGFKKRLDRARPIKEKNWKKKPVNFFAKALYVYVVWTSFIATLFMVVLSESFFFFSREFVCDFLFIKAFIYCSGKKEKEKNITWHGQFRLSQRLNETSGISKRAVRTLCRHIFPYKWPCVVLVLSQYGRNAEKKNRTVAFLYESVWCPMVGSVNSLFGCVCVCYYVVGSWQKGAEIGYLGPIGSYKRTWDE